MLMVEANHDMCLKSMASYGKILYIHKKILDEVKFVELGRVWTKDVVDNVRNSLILGRKKVEAAKGISVSTQ